MPGLTEPDFLLERARQAARDENGGHIRRRVPTAEFTERHTNDAGVYINVKGVPNVHMAPGEQPRRRRPDGTFPAGPGRPRGSRSTDLTGQVFGHLTVIERVEDAPGSKAQYRCLCDCGTGKVIRGDNLKSGKTVSCGHKGYGRPYDAIGPLQAPPAVFDEDAEVLAHRERARVAREQMAASEAEAKALRAEKVREARNARRRERRRQAAIQKWSTAI